MYWGMCEERISDGKLKPVTAKTIMLKLAAIQTARRDVDKKLHPINKKNMKEQSAWPYCPNGCGDKVTPRQLEEHKSTACQKAVVKCTAGRFCTWSGYRCYQDEHAQSCAFIKTSPVLTSLLEENKTMLEMIGRREAQLKDADANYTSLKDQLVLANSKCMALQDQLTRANSKCLSLQEQVDALTSRLGLTPALAPTLPPKSVTPCCLHDARLGESRSSGVRIEPCFTIGATGKCYLFRNALADTSVSSGVHYWEVTKLEENDCYAAVGVVDGTLPSGSRIGTTANSWGIRIYHACGAPEYSGAWHANTRKDFNVDWPKGCVIGLLLDADSGTLTVYKDGVMIAPITPRELRSHETTGLLVGTEINSVENISASFLHPPKLAGITGGQESSSSPKFQPVTPCCLHDARLGESRSSGVRIEACFTIGATGKCDLFRNALADTSVSSGVHYWEVTKLEENDCYAAVGVVDGTLPSGSRIGTTPNSWGIRIYHACGAPEYSGAWHANTCKDFNVDWPT
ncbi:hypothetical protein Pelo_1297 [Pelomyxa schiedti]|nr:hypothetical protein Pelo_1297 [Pelomyxa schiedti]